VLGRAGGPGQQFAEPGPGGLAVLLLGAVFAGDDEYVAFGGELGAGQGFKPLLRGVREPGQARKKTQLHGGGHLVHVLAAVAAAPYEFFFERAGADGKIGFGHLFYIIKKSCGLRVKFPIKEYMANIVLITGASAGIGYATAELLLKNGFRVYAGARRVEKMRGLEALGAKLLRLDVTEEASVAGAVAAVLAAEGRLDALVNNAGYGAHGAVEDVPVEEARRQFEVNLFGLARLTQLVLPHMRAQGGGRIINISSIAGRISMPTGGWYHASKYALEAYSDALRLETAQFGIKVALIEPGPIKTEWDATALVNLNKYSGAGVYGPMVRRLTEKFRAGYRSGAPGPEVVARVILKALTSSRPAARYPVPFKASFIIFLKWVLPDRVLDWALRRSLEG